MKARKKVKRAVASQAATRKKKPKSKSVRSRQIRQICRQEKAAKKKSFQEGRCQKSRAEKGCGKAVPFQEGREKARPRGGCQAGAQTGRKACRATAAAATASRDRARPDASALCRRPQQRCARLPDGASPQVRRRRGATCWRRALPNSSVMTPAHCRIFWPKRNPSAITIRGVSPSCPRTCGIAASRSPARWTAR